jgi:hypothetical protein
MFELDLLFANEAGQPVDVRNLVGRVYKPAAKRAGLREIRFRVVEATRLRPRGR